MNAKNKKWFSCLFIVLLLVCTSGCGDENLAANGGTGNFFSFNDNSSFGSEGGSSGTGNLDTGGGSSGTGVTTISQGVVTGFGSIFMNGIVFDTASATITIDGLPAIETDLRVGMAGRITGEADLTSATGVASLIEIIFNVKGPVDKIDLANNTLTVAGQKIIINLLTVFENGTAETLKLGDILEISGLSDTVGGAIYASYIRISPFTTEQIEVTGIVNSVNTNKQTFKIGGQIIDYSATSANIIEAMPVRVTGTRDQNSVIIASRIEDLTTAPPGNENDILILEGIADFGLRIDALQQQSFNMSSLTIYIKNNTGTDDTIFVNGTTSDIGSDTRLKVIGQFISPGILSADKIEFYVPPNVTAVGNIESIDLPANQISIAGLLIDINNSTRMLDVSSAALQKFSINNLSVGDQLTTYVIKLGESVSALFLRRDNIASESQLADGTITFQGFANTPAEPFLNIGSITVDTSNASSFFNSARNLISSDNFFAAVSGSSLIKAQGRWQNTRLTATSVQFINLGNLTVVLTSDNTTIAGGNDFFSVWDGSFNTEDDVANGTTRENMFISNRQSVLGAEWRAYNIRVFGPGTYSFDACSNNPNPDTPCAVTDMIVGENQIGVHMLVDWGGETNIDIVNVWDRNQTFCPANSSTCSLYQLIENPAWDLVSSDADNDGISGITLQDGRFAYDITVNFNLNF